MFEKPCLVLAAILLAVTACGDTTTATRSARGAAATETSSTEPLAKGYSANRDPRGAIAAALEKAKSDHRPVLLDFGADWCSDCIVLERMFQKDSVREALSDFHVVAVNVGKFDRNLGLVKKYGLDLHASGIPALVVLSPNGQIRATTNDGSFEKSSSMSAEELAAYLRRLR